MFSVPEGMEGELELDVVHEAGGGKVIASGPVRIDILYII